MVHHGVMWVPVNMLRTAMTSRVSSAFWGALRPYLLSVTRSVTQPLDHQPIIQGDSKIEAIPIDGNFEGERDAKKTLEKALYDPWDNDPQLTSLQLERFDDPYPLVNSHSY